MPILHDKGISRMAGEMKVEKGKWYWGFICKECGAKIFALENTQQITTTTEPIAIGKGTFSMPCRACRSDEIIFDTADLIPIQADNDETGSPALPRRQPSGSGRQKLANRYPKAKATFGPRFLEDRPECATIIARCSATWSYIEVETALLLATILKINTEPALAMFLAMQSTRTQIDVISAAAEAVLSENDFKLFVATMNVRKGLETDRNNLIHGIFGGSLLVENGILWIEQKNFTRHTATVWGTDYSQMKTKYIDEVFVYEAEDLETVAQNLEWMHQFLGSLRGYVGSSDAALRDKLYPQLCSEPRIRAELNRLYGSNTDQKNSSAGPQQ